MGGGLSIFHWVVLLVLVGLIWIIVRIIQSTFK